MPRPKSDLERVSYKLGAADREALKRLADERKITKNEMIRVLIRSELKRSERRHAKLTGGDPA